MLDVGCGYGASGRWLAQRGCRVVGLTVSRRQASIARRLSARRGLGERTTFLRADATALPFARETFDLVWVIECLEHLTDKPRFLRASASLLRPGGRLALCSWQRAAGDSDAREQVEAVCDAFLCPGLATVAEYRSWCEAAGLEIIYNEDLTTAVRRTWDVLIGRFSGWWMAPLRPLLPRDLRRFLAGFNAIARAYDSGAMSYGLWIAARQGKPRLRP